MIHKCSIQSINPIKPLKCKTEINNFTIFIFEFCIFWDRNYLCGDISLFHIFLFSTFHFFDVDCNHYHTKRLKFIKICIAKIQINRIQIIRKKTQKCIHTYPIHYCNGTTKIKVLLLLLLLFYLFVYWLAFQHSNAIHYSFHNERIYWSSRWVGIFLLTFYGKFSYKNGITIMNKKNWKKIAICKKKTKCIRQAARKK